MVQLSTGDMLREARTSGTEMGRKVAEVMERGQLVTDEIVIGLIEEKLDAGAAGGFIFDGFPRTLRQADALGDLLAKKGLTLDAVIELVVDDAALVGRIVKRAEEARAAGQPVRKDDTPEVFEVRLREYYKNTAPLVGYYWAKRDLVQIDGMAEMQDVATAIASVLDKS
jgi:adenylate kinase